MKLSELPALQEVVDRQREDPEFREESDRSVFAREVAIRIALYRADRGLTQTQLAVVSCPGLLVAAQRLLEATLGRGYGGDHASP